MMFDGYFEGYDPSYELVFNADWTSWEEDGWIFIFQKDGRYFSIEGGHCVMASNVGAVYTMPDDLYEMTQDEALEAMLEWAEHENLERI